MLALQCGVLDVRRMLEALSCSQIDEWFHFYQSNPWGYAVEGYRTGQVCSAVMNSSGRYKKMIRPQDFLLKIN